jgi:hypothetical protein
MLPEAEHFSGGRYYWINWDDQPVWLPGGPDAGQDDGGHRGAVRGLREDRPRSPRPRGSGGYADSSDRPDDGGTQSCGSSRVRSATPATGCPTRSQIRRQRSRATQPAALIITTPSQGREGPRAPQRRRASLRQADGSHPDCRVRRPPQGAQRSMLAAYQSPPRTRARTAQ